MLYLKSFLTESNILDKFSTYDFDKKIFMNKNSIKSNALNIKEVIHTACKWCLDDSCQLFMFEIAIAETSLGTSPKSKALTGNIGRSVFHIDESTFEWTKIRHNRINNALDNLKKKGIIWDEIKWSDISNNILIGAICCKLVLLKKGLNKSTADKLLTLENRANIYSKYYNGGGSKNAQVNYINNVKAWCKVLQQKGAEYLNFSNKKYSITDKGLVSE